MPTEPGAYVAFLRALSDAYAASGLAPNAFTAGAQGIPAGGTGVQGDSGGVVAPAATSAALGGGASVPGTATTGQSLLEEIVAGGVDPASAEAESLINRLRGIGGGEPGERGDLGAGVMGGDVGALLSVLGGPLAPATILASLVASDASGLPLDPSLLTASGLASLAAGTDPGEFGSGRVGDLGRDVLTGAASAALAPSILGGVGRQESAIDRGRTERDIQRGGRDFSGRQTA